ncbi:MAG: porin, partial [Planctomycetota bacterium]|nr:porin [Planctomycetota bacterium]
RADEVRGLVQDVLADADTRASLLAQGMTAGYDNGAVIASADGNWLLRTNILMQQRFVLNSQSAATGSPTDEDRWGFENTRTKFILSGNVVSPDWFYRVDINVGVGTGRTGTGNAYLGYDYGNGWKVLLGTMKAPTLREELVEAQHQLLVERSNANYFYTTGYVDGVALDYLGDQFHVMAMLSDGGATGGTVWSTQDTDFALSARVEWLAMGNWDQFTDFTSPNGSERGIMVGGALHYQTSEDVGGLPDIDILILTGDVSVEYDGWNAFAALVYTSTDLPTPFLDVDTTAIVIQGGYYLSDNWELFGRYEWSDFDLVTVPATEDLNIFTVGATRYFAGHNAKWTTDIGIGFDEVTLPANITGFRTDDPGEDGQVVIRSQVQILF